MRTSRWLPHPLLSLCLLVVWLLLVNDLSLGHWLLGALLGWLIPLVTQVFWINPPRLQRPLKLCLFLLRVLGDIVVANLQVAKLILGPGARLRPAFVEIPLRLEDELALTMLASVISLTPGTVSADLSDDRKTLLVHSLDVGDEAAMVREIQARYEAPLLEVFPCSTT
ncbi:Na+/H+ antiporter subunit E [Pseudomonas lalucatii]|uniref:Na+/H+ antiporter subunit E n=1 Tax=Pseudomonas lalucatii TaxID=1424203 RepID=A0ABS5PYM3_9PSED|nr:Na+/H+ antiporter subunit E [Pseudomonas lalucatii]MBS7661414.1 Na+/H+ antiporter subunit E [Pseudomonas lalucatii]MBS7691787.1 Na+/H+ antiporter subunit E [Pseudomonas lalucatii]MBS7724100.1 Na+/H+ antiporter subunit E [Pseudomonas lalucatii]